MEIEFIKIDRSKGPVWVPVVEKTLLHSAVKPEKEASLFIDREWECLKEVNTVIVFGLAGGFHIAELIKRKPFNVFVIEAEKDLIPAMENKWPSLLNQIDVFAGYPAHQLVQELQAEGVFSRAYAVLKHPASVRLQPLFYKTIQQILNNRTLLGLRELAAKNERLAQFFDSLDIQEDQILTLPMVEEALIRRGTGLEHEGLIWMALRELLA